jgi:hypothetical protein
MITTPLEIKTFYDIRDAVRFYNITPINPERWNEIDGEEAFEEYYELYHPNVVFGGWVDIYELELGKIQDRHFVVFEADRPRNEDSYPIYVIELPMPTKVEEQI